MSIQTVCPNCDRQYTLADQMDGKTIRCKGCAATFRVESESSRRVRLAPTVEVEAAEVLDELDDVEPTEQRPRKTSKKAAKTRPKKGKPLWPLLLGCGVACILLPILGICALGGWYHQKYEVGVQINETNYDKLSLGMNDKQVNAILGPPKKTTNQFWNGLGPKIDVAEWVKDQTTITVEYHDGEAVKITGKFVVNGETHERGAPNVPASPQR